MLTFLDTCVLMAAWKGEDDLAQRAFNVIEDTGRKFIVSDYLELELLPKPSFHGYKEEVEFYKMFLDAADIRIPPSEDISKRAISLASKYDMSAMDALHYSIACEAGADEFITAEKPTKPFFATKELNVSTIYVDSVV